MCNVIVLQHFCYMYHLKSKTILWYISSFMYTTTSFCGYHNCLWIICPAIIWDFWFLKGQTLRLFVLFTEIRCKPPGSVFQCTSLCMWLVLWVMAEPFSQTVSSQSHWHLPAAHSICFFQGLWTLAFPSNQLAWHLCATLVSISHLHFKKILKTDDNSQFIPGSSLLCDLPLDS